MTIKRLKEFLSVFGSKHDDMEIVISGTDHSYQRVCLATTVDAELNSGELFEYFSDSNMSYGGIKVKVLELR